MAKKNNKKEAKKIDKPENKIRKEILNKVITGDLSALTVEERQEYYIYMCKMFELDPATKPFDYLILDGKLMLYATRNCTDQLRKIHNISTTSVTINFVGNMVYAIACIQDKQGRQEFAVGAEVLEANDRLNVSDKIMMAETKAKRRATISMFALGMLDESEVATIKNAQRYVANEQIANDNIDMLERQSNIEKLKGLPQELRQRMSKHYKLNPAIDMCKSLGWDIEKIIEHLNDLEKSNEHQKTN